MSDFHIYVKDREPSLSVVIDSTMKLKRLAILPSDFWPRLNEEYLEIVNQAVYKKQTNKQKAHRCYHFDYLSVQSEFS